MRWKITEAPLSVQLSATYNSLNYRKPAWQRLPLSASLFIFTKHAKCGYYYGSVNFLKIIELYYIKAIKVIIQDKPLQFAKEENKI